MSEKEIIYFIEWLAKKTGASINKILMQFPPHNQTWYAYNPKNYFELINKVPKYNWLTYGFNLYNNILNEDYEFYSKISSEWGQICSNNQKNIKFCRYKLNENFQIIEKPNLKFNTIVL